MVEKSIHQVFDHHLQKSFSCVLGWCQGHWVRMEAAIKSCGQNVTSVSQGGNFRWSSEMNAIIKLTCWARLAAWSEGYCLARTAAAAKFWEEFREAMEKDFWVSSKKFRETIRKLQKRKQSSAKSASLGWALLLSHFIRDSKKMDYKIRIILMWIRTSECLGPVHTIWAN